MALLATEMVKRVPVSDQGKVALVDDEDYRIVSAHRWHMANSKGVEYPMLYYRTNTGISMHKFILGTRPGLVIDHANGNTLDNTRGNLRWVTQRQNVWNSRGKSNRGLAHYKGISKAHWKISAKCFMWRAQISVVSRGRKTFASRCVDDPNVAAAIYDSYASCIFGDYAWLNFKGVISNTPSQMGVVA